VNSPLLKSSCEQAKQSTFFRNFSKKKQL